MNLGYTKQQTLKMTTKLPTLYSLSIDNLKDKIEAELGELEWINEPNNKTTKIRKTLPYDVSDLNIQEKAVKEHINLALQFKETFSKYLD